MPSPWHSSQRFCSKTSHRLAAIACAVVMIGFRYQMTFIDAVAEPAEVIRAKSCPPVLKTPKVSKDASSLELIYERKRLALRVSKLQERSQQLTTGRPNELDLQVPGQAVPSMGSYGHPNICRRPCIFMARGACEKGADCGFCHLTHELQPPSFDKRQRELLKHLPPVAFMELILPYVRDKVEGSALPGAGQVLQLLESEIVVRASASTLVQGTVQGIPRRVRHVLERMSLANLVSLICSTMSNRFPKFLVNELKDLRETARILEV
eukprot:s714_g3.t1